MSCRTTFGQLIRGDAVDAKMGMPKIFSGKRRVKFALADKREGSRPSSPEDCACQGEMLKVYAFTGLFCGVKRLIERADERQSH